VTHPIEVVSNPRVDLLVTDIDGRPRRSTTYSGTIRFGPSPITTVMGMTAVQGSSGGLGPHTLVGFLPDGLPYLGAQLDGASLIPEFSLLAVYEQAHVQSAGARFAPDPRGTAHAWIELNLSFVGQDSAVYAYRVRALVAPDAVDPPSS
jgi:hypothetical protein